MAKQYGLIVPNKSKSLHPLGVVKPSIFQDDSDSDADTAKPTGLKTALKRQDRLLQEKAIEEDPTVYQYDELYDDIEAKRKESKLSRKDLDKKPKYINKLLASAERRKRENERRIERQVQKEREAEGEQFKDKESFVTSAYRAKLEELKKLDEQEQREDYLESIGDVKKQGNLDGFYRHLYDQKVLYEDREKNEAEVKQEPCGDKEDQTDAMSTSTCDGGNRQKSMNKASPKKRKYRKRDESSESDPETPMAGTEKNLQHLPSNIDADSDFSIDSSDSDEENGVKKVNTSQQEAQSVLNSIEEKDSDKQIDDVETVGEEKGTDAAESSDMVENKNKIANAEEDKPKVNIWKKRTVGAVFDEALKRYFERKVVRDAGTYIRPV